MEINSRIFRTECDAVEMLAYARCVLDARMRGDLLAPKVALAPRVIGYPDIATRLASRPDAHAATSRYRVWIAEYAGAPYQEAAAKARAHLEDLADHYATPAREAELIVIFKEATRLRLVHGRFTQFVAISLRRSGVRKVLTSAMI